MRQASPLLRPHSALAMAMPGRQGSPIMVLWCAVKEGGRLKPIKHVSLSKNGICSQNVRFHGKDDMINHTDYQVWGALFSCQEKKLKFAVKIEHVLKPTHPSLTR